MRRITYFFDIGSAETGLNSSNARRRSVRGIGVKGLKLLHAGSSKKDRWVVFGY
jgi:hypothetical protein